MRKLFALLLGLMLISGISEAQYPHPRISATQITSDMYQNEMLLFLNLESATLLVDGTYKDTLVVFAKAYWNSKSAENDLGQCFNDSNEGGLTLDSVVVGVASSAMPHIIAKVLQKPGESQYIGLPVFLKEGRVAFIREFHRRIYDCGVEVWLVLTKPKDSRGL